MVSDVFYIVSTAPRIPVHIMIVIIIMKKNGEGKVSAFQVPKDKFTKGEEECKKLLNVKSKTQARTSSK